MKEPDIENYEMANPHDAYSFGGEQATHTIWKFLKHLARKCKKNNNSDGYLALMDAATRINKGECWGDET